MNLQEQEKLRQQELQESWRGGIQQIFDDIYRNKTWGDGSGGGNTPEVSKPFMEAASRVIQRFGITSVIDIGCGDGHATQHLDLHGASYVGVELVDCMVDYCCTQYPGRNVIRGDARTMDLPHAGLALLKEVTQHLSNADVWWLVNNIHKNTPLILHCSTANGPTINLDIKTGETRSVMLSQPPFNYSVCHSEYWFGGSGQWRLELLVKL
jgi:SAM-dependent methyltransferase